MAAESVRPRERRLADVVREMKIREADRLDVVERDNEVARGRLELLADELEGVFEEAGGEEEGFDFSLSSGANPRLWVDAATHVSVAADGETFRVLRDGRGGRTVLAETGDIDEAADAVTRYVATRSLERERLFDAAATPDALPRARSGVPFGGGAVATSGVAHAGGAAGVAPAPRRPSRAGRLVRAIIWLLLGMALGVGLLFLAFGERLGFTNPVPGEYRFYEPYLEPYLPAPGGAAVPGAVLPGTDGAGADPDGAGLDPDDPDVEVTTVPVETVEPAEDAADDGN